MAEGRRRRAVELGEGVGSGKGVESLTDLKMSLISTVEGCPAYEPTLCQNFPFKHDI